MRAFQRWFICRFWLFGTLMVNIWLRRWISSCWSLSNPVFNRIDWTKSRPMRLAIRLIDRAQWELSKTPLIAFIGAVVMEIIGPLCTVILELLWLPWLQGLSCWEGDAACRLLWNKIKMSVSKIITFTQSTELSLYNTALFGARSFKFNNTSWCWWFTYQQPARYNKR